jgi:hypothetical protein
MYNNTTGSDNTAVGAHALVSNTSGGSNTGFGKGALQANTIGARNTATGWNSLQNNSSGADNAAFGYDALVGVTGARNTAIGSRAGDNISSGTDNIVIGSSIDAQSATGSNQVNIGNYFQRDSGGNIYIKPSGSGNAFIYNSSRKADWYGDSGNWNMGMYAGGTGTQHYIDFRLSNNSQVGYIKTNGSSVQYITSSDYRLKENVVPMTGSIDRLKTLKPSKFNFIADADTTVDGFLAHEAQEVVPEAISGIKDGMRTEEYEVTPAIEEVRDEEGSIITEAVEAVMGEREVEVYQGIDQSKLVPLLVASLQEAVSRIETLEAQLNA